jgi:hypothetical protein
MENKQKAALSRQVTHNVSVSADKWQQGFKGASRGTAAATLGM